MDTEILIIGAGVVGLAIARELSASGSSVMLIERHPHFGEETSSRNSEVVHAGIYYPPHSLKAKMCVAGNKSLNNYAIEKKIPFKKIGKFIVASSAYQIPGLDKIYKNAIASGVENLQIVDADFVREREPLVKCEKAIWSPNTAIIDSHAITRS